MAFRVDFLPLLLLTAVFSWESALFNTAKAEFNQKVTDIG
jgi:hypothetical protein